MRPCRGAPTPPPARLPADSLGLRPTRDALALRDQASALPRAPRRPRPPPSRRAPVRAAPSSRARRRDPRRGRGRPEPGARPGDPGRPRDRSPRRERGVPPADRRAWRPRTPPIAPRDDESAHGCRVRAARPAPPGRPPPTPIPSCSAARSSRAGSPTGSAAARSTSCCVGAGRSWSRRKKLRSSRVVIGEVGRDGEAARQLTAAWARGSSSKASGFPRVSATIRSSNPLVEASADHRREQRARVLVVQTAKLKRGQTGEGSDRRSARATANTITTDSPTSRRATNASV